MVTRLWPYWRWEKEIVSKIELLKFREFIKSCEVFFFAIKMRLEFHEIICYNFLKSRSNAMKFHHCFQCLSSNNSGENHNLRIIFHCSFAIIVAYTNIFWKIPSRMWKDRLVRGEIILQFLNNLWFIYLLSSAFTLQNFVAFQFHVTQIY